LAYVSLVGHDVREAIAEAKRATALDSSDAEARQILAKAYEYAGEPAAAVDEARRAARSQTLNAAARAELGYALYFDRRYDDALAELASVARLEPPLRRAPGYTAEVYMSQGRWSEAVTLLRSLPYRSYQHEGLIGYAFGRSGATDSAKRILGQLLPVAADSGYAFEVAEIYIGLGDLDHAFYWLERSVDDFSILPIVSGPLFCRRTCRSSHRTSASASQSSGKPLGSGHSYMKGPCAYWSEHLLPCGQPPYFAGRSGWP
jgi:tetratricopeptide (TPR) repeat protein